MYKKHKWFSTIISESYLNEIQVVQEIKKNGFANLIEELKKHRDYQNNSEKHIYTILISTLTKLYDLTSVFSVDGDTRPIVVLEPLIELWFSQIYKLKHLEKLKTEYILVSLWLDYLQKTLVELEQQSFLQLLISLATKTLLNKIFDVEALVLFDVIFEDYKTQWKIKVKEYKLHGDSKKSKKL